MASIRSGRAVRVGAAGFVVLSFVVWLLWLFDLVSGWWLMVGLSVGVAVVPFVGMRIRDGKAEAAEGRGKGSDSLRLLLGVHLAVVVWVVFLLNDLGLLVVALVPTFLAFTVARAIGRRFNVLSVRWLAAAPSFLWIGLVWTFDLDIGSGSRWPTVGGFFVEGIPVLLATGLCLLVGIFEAGREVRARLHHRSAAD